MLYGIASICMVPSGLLPLGSPEGTISCYYHRGANLPVPPRVAIVWALRTKRRNRFSLRVPFGPCAPSLPTWPPPRCHLRSPTPRHGRPPQRLLCFTSSSRRTRGTYSPVSVPVKTSRRRRHSLNRLACDLPAALKALRFHPSVRPGLQVKALEGGYPGGLSAYLANARSLLKASAAGDNPFAGMTPEVPTGVELDYATPDFMAAEEVGLALFKDCAFVLVAGVSGAAAEYCNVRSTHGKCCPSPRVSGGLGERLGYKGIKLSLPVQTTTGASYLAVYVAQILAMQVCGESRRSGPASRGRKCCTAVTACCFRRPRTCCTGRPPSCPWPS